MPPSRFTLRELIAAAEATGIVDRGRKRAPICCCRWRKPIHKGDVVGFFLSNQVPPTLRRCLAGSGYVPLWAAKLGIRTHAYRRPPDDDDH